MRHLKLFEEWKGWEAPPGSRKLISFENRTAHFEINTEERKALIVFKSEEISNIATRDIKWFSENENDDVTQDISDSFEAELASKWDIDIDEPVELVRDRSVIICLSYNGESYNDFRIRTRAKDFGHRTGKQYGV